MARSVRAELLQLAREPGITIGAHTVSHPRLSRLPRARQRAELALSRAALAAATGRRVDLLSYPFGKQDDVTDETRALAAAAGYAAAFSSIPGALQVRSDRYMLPRMSVHEWSGEEFAARMRHHLGTPPALACRAPVRRDCRGPRAPSAARTRDRARAQPRWPELVVAAATAGAGLLVDRVAEPARMDRGGRDGVREPAPPIAGPPPRRRSAGPFVLALVALLAVLAGLGYLLATQLTNNDGSGTIPLRNVIGSPVDQATLLLEDDGFKVETDYEVNDEVPVNEVFKQDPEPGAKLEKGETVTLTVSEGKGKVPVPDVTGASLEDAEAELEDAGLRVQVRQESSDEVEAGKVIRTDPAGNVQVDRDSTVTVYVSRGVELVQVPDVTGKDAVEAAAELGSHDLTVERVSEASDSVEAGKVIRTDPPAGSSVGKGSKVRLVVSSGKEEVRVPSVINLSQADATAALEDAGFKVVVQEATTLDASRAGRVIAQTPTGNSRAERGSTVTITVAKLGTGASTSSSSSTTTTTGGIFGGN